MTVADFSGIRATDQKEPPRETGAVFCLRVMCNPPTGNQATVIDRRYISFLQQLTETRQDFPEQGVPAAAGELEGDEFLG